MTKTTEKNLNNIFNAVYKVLVGIVAIWVVFVLSSMFFAPEPYELHKDASNPARHYVCPGDTFIYESNVVVRRTPITLVRTDSWFSEQTKNSIVPDRYETMEVFNWDKNVRNIVPRRKNVVVPSTTMDGKPIPPGNYRYIVHLNAWGETTPASMTFNVTIKKDCS